MPVRAMVSAVLSIRTSYTNASGVPFAQVSLWDIMDYPGPSGPVVGTPGTNPGITAPYLGLGFLIDSDTPWAIRTDTFPLVPVSSYISGGHSPYNDSSLAALVSSLKLTFFHWTSASPQTVSAQFLISSVWIDISFDDGATARYTASTVGQIDDPRTDGFAQVATISPGADDHLPATLSGTQYGGLAHGWNPFFFQLSDWVPVDFIPADPPPNPVPGNPDPAWLVIDEPDLGFTDRTPYLFVGDGQQNSWSTQLRQRGQATIHLFVAAGDPYAPVRGAPVYLYDQTSSDTTFLVFAGLIQDIENKWTGQNAGDHFVLITAVSLESVFDTVYAPPVQYVNQTAGAIVTDLFSRFETGCPVTPGTISDGAIIPLLNTNFEKLSDLFSQLATTSQFTWYVDPSTRELMFVAPSLIPAPATLADDPVLWDSIQWKVNGADYRNRQAVRLNEDAFAHSAEFFVGAGQTDFQLLRPVKQVTNAWATLSTCNTATGTFSGNPSAGDTITIGTAAETWLASHAYALGGTIIVSGFVQKVTFAGTTGSSIPTFSTLTGGTTIDGTAIWTCQGPAGLSTGTDTYTFVATLDNTQFGQVLIGASSTATCLNLVDAINANTAVRGKTFSLPTWECSLCNAVNNSGTSFTIQRKNAGSGWIAALSETSGAFSWSSALTTGGTSPQGSLGPGEGATISLQVYVAGTSTAAPALVYTPGDSIVHLASPLNVGSNLNVEYTRADGGVIEVENTALVDALAIVTHGTGKYQQITDASNTGLIATSSAAGLQFAQEALAAFSVAPQAMEFQTYVPGLQAGMSLPVSLLYPDGGIDLLNATWVIEEINAELIPVEFWIGLDALPGTAAYGGGHYRYTVKTVNLQEIGSFLVLGEGVGGGGGGGGGGVSGLVATSGGGLARSGGYGTVTHNDADLADHRVVVGNSVDDVETIASTGTAGQYLRSGGSSADPAFASIAESEVTSLVTDLAAKVPATRLISTTAPLTGGGDLSADRTIAINNFAGDSGSGGAKGAVPAPAAGDAAAGKFIKADGTWAVPAGTASGTVTHTGAALGAHKVVVGNGSDDLETISATGTAGQYLRSGGSSADPAMATIAASELPASVQSGALGIVIDGAGSAPATGSKGFLQVPYGCTVTGWTMLSDVSGSAQITIKKSTYSGFPSTTSIVASAQPALSSAQKNTSTTLTGWTTSITSGDVLEFNLDSATTVTRLILELQVTKS